MAYIDPYLFGIFRQRMRNPRCMWHVYRQLCEFSAEDLRNPERSGFLVDRLSATMGVPITPEQRANAVHWLCTCGVDPAHPVHRRRMWGMIVGY